MDIDDRRSRSAPGEEGEIEVRGPQVMLGYWGRPEETAEVFHDGWLRTGDIGRMDADGCFYVVDRRKDMINVSGFKVLAARGRGGAASCTRRSGRRWSAGVPDPYRGETVKAFVVLKPGESAADEEIVEFCRLHLAAFKVPRKVDFRTELPKTMVGKYLRRVLVDEEGSSERCLPRDDHRRAPLVPELRGGRPARDRRSRHHPARASSTAPSPACHKVPSASSSTRGCPCPPSPGRSCATGPGASRPPSSSSGCARATGWRSCCPNCPAGVPDRLLRGSAHRRDPGQHEPDVRRARDAPAA